MATRALPRSRYRDRPYRIIFTRDGRGPRAGWVAFVEELPGCEASGATMEDAAVAVQDAMDAWIAEALESGRPIPAPRLPSRKHGPIALDVPPSLEVALTRGAVREGMELRAYITTALAAAVGWRPAEDEPGSTWLAVQARRFGGTGDPSARRLLRFTAIGNAILVGLIAIVALVLLYVALKNA
jgi:predicted RNase H-like HicB family nuclease